jgi:hypothetical protein
MKQESRNIQELKSNLESQLQERADVTRDLRERDGNSQLSDVEPIDEYVSSLGFNKIGSSWIAINVTQAKLVLEAVLHKDLAYTSCEQMTIDAAKKVASDFIACFCADAKFFTNGRWHEKNASWMAVTESTFDGGVVAFDEHLLGIIWVEAED